MFPFLFGVMFGDIGHGSILLSAGVFLLYKYEDLKKIPEMKDILDLR
jgi:vacuolar-type H+-ATPase subunit I/STV1